jgi:aldose 1-epimerase
MSDISTAVKVKPERIVLDNGQIRMQTTNIGARIEQLFVPDKFGELENVILGVDYFEDYPEDICFMGATVGPVAGRIGGGVIDDVVIEPNENGNVLHGGKNGWSNQVWEGNSFSTSEGVGVSYSLHDTTSGFPGPIDVVVTYELIGKTLKHTVRVKSEEDTYVNPTNHAYFNLSGDNKKTIRNQILQVKSSKRMELDYQSIPTGNLLDNVDTPYDFTSPVKIGTQLSKIAGGIDDVFVLDTNSMQPKLSMIDVESGRKMDIETDRECFVIYTATNTFMHKSVNGAPMCSERGLAIEPQDLSNKDNLEGFGSTKLSEGNVSEFVTSYKFSTI